MIPVFALFNAGIVIEGAALGRVLQDPVTLGVMLGLVAGKVIGIVGASWLAIKFNIASLPTDARLSQLVGVGLIGGIGFTMSIFIAELAFAGMPEQLLMAKTGILFASFIAGMAGYAWLRWLTPLKSV